MKIEYKCPICRANNTLTKQNIFCRRCKSDLGSVYKLKQNVVYEVLTNILEKDNDDI